MDEIRRKLDVIDRQLSGRNATSRLIGTAPLLLPAIGLMAGILLQGKLPMLRAEDHTVTLLRMWSVLLALCAAGTLTYFIRNHRHPRPDLLACGAALCFLCLGPIRLIAFATPAPDDVRRLVGTERRLATIRGRLVTEPYVEQREWAFARFDRADPATAFYLELEQIEAASGWRRVGGTVRVRIAEPAPNLHLGDSIEAYCWLHRFENPSNPGQFKVAAYLRRRNVYIGAAVPSREAVTVRREDPPGIGTALRRTLSRAAAQALLDRPPADTPGEGLLEALLLGRRGNIDRETYEAFRKTGLLHLISLSGMHLGIVIGLVWWCGKTFGLLKRARALVCIAATILFLLVVPPRAPTIRAAIIVFVYCCAVFLRRRASAPNSLALAAIILLLLRPTNLFEAGWQLSFAAVAGILALTRKIERFLHEKSPRHVREFVGRGYLVTAALQRTGSAASRLFAAGLAAWLGGAGILLYHFHTITPLASLWTVLVFPLVVAILTLGVLKMVLFVFVPTLSLLCGGAALVLTNLLIATVHVLARLDVSRVLIGHVSVTPIVLYYVLIFLVAFAPGRRRILKRIACVVLALVLLAYLGAVKWQRTHREHLSLTCLDVGHGQAILVQLPGSANLLFDAGSLYTADVGTRTVHAFLDYAGIDRLHAVIVSHHDVDHINGVPEIAAGRPIDHVYATGEFLAQTQTQGTARFLAQCLRQQNLSIEHVPPTARFGPATITTLWPVDGMAFDAELNDNDRSLVTLIEFAGAKILLCSDIEQFAQRQFLQLYPGLRADVVVAPHHGSVRTLHPDFLPTLRPSVLLCSCGKPEQAEQLASHHKTDASLLCTAVNGAITICVDSRGVIEKTAYMVAAGD